MPIYTYRVRRGDTGCDQCRDIFEVRHGMDDERLAVCPACNSPVERIITGANYVRGSYYGDSLSRERLKSSGLRKLVKGDDGQYVDDTPR